ncbi:hypothetical protein, partial [Hymenobacter sp.]|uniref:hypothetical protein n=1 Tax=Hymenobacter sp. TaxID=1898978 RepID=UPI002EDA5E84
ALALLAQDADELRFTKAALFHGAVGKGWEKIPPSSTFHWPTSWGSLQHCWRFCLVSMPG